MRLAVVNLLQQLGWLINFKKSVLVPAQQLEHLGFVLLNTVTMTASLPAQKIRDIRRSIQQVLNKPHRQSPRVIHSSQPNNTYPGSHLCSFPRQMVYTTSPVLQELSCQERTGLGQTSPIRFSQSGGTLMVVHQTQEMGRSLFSSFNAHHPNYLCGRQQHGLLGLELGQALSPRILGSRGGSNPIDQLARIESSLWGVTDISDYEELD
ncbi:hypothetical protein PS15m_005062 [Mucor circinelloides]